MIDDDSDEESSSNNSAGGAPSAYWCPQDGNIAILPDNMAKDIATLTNSTLYKEPDHHRVRLMNGDMKQALQTLQTLEPLLVSLHFP